MTSNRCSRHRLQGQVCLINGLVDLLALNGTTLLTLERGVRRDGQDESGAASHTHPHLQDRCSAATDIAALDSLKGHSEIVPVTKTLLLDLATVQSLSPELAPSLDNFEGMTFGPRLPDGRATLLLVSDDNFSEQATHLVPAVCDTVMGSGSRSFQRRNRYDPAHSRRGQVMNVPVVEAINRQINSELSASYSYLAMSAWCEGQKFTGAARWLRLQSQEEYMHAMKLFDFVLARDAKVDLKPLEQPRHDFKSLADVFERRSSRSRKSAGRSTRSTRSPSRKRRSRRSPSCSGS